MTTADHPPDHESELETVFDFFRSHKRPLLAALAFCFGDAARHSDFDAEISYITSVAQAILDARPAVARQDVIIPQPASPPVPLQHAEGALDHRAPKPEASATSPTVPKRRHHSDAFDLCLFAAIHAAPRLKYDVGLDVVFRVAQTFDPAAERPSLIAKLNRWKNSGLLRWVTSKQMYVTPNGEAHYRALIRATSRPGGGREEAASALNQSLGLTLDFDAILAARSAS